MTTMNWSVAIFAAREDVETLSATISAVRVAVAGTEKVTVDVVVNGNIGLAEKATALLNPDLTAESGLHVRIWHIPLGDKAHAWNEYLYRIWPGSDLAFFVDGYARVFPDALRLISAAMNAVPRAMAGTGVPSMGFSARAMRRRMRSESCIYGNLYAVRGQVMQILKARGFHLLLGMYRTDALLNASICFGLDPAKFDWDCSRIVVEWRASWALRPLRFWRPVDIRAYFKRMLRQAEGLLITEAIKQHLAVERKPPESLPGTAAELVNTWLAAFPGRAHRLMLMHPLCWIAVDRIRKPRNWSLSAQTPILLKSTVLPAEKESRVAIGQPFRSGQ